MIGEDPLDLGGQIALVTGAGQGAGRAIALALARHNAGGVAVNDFVPERAQAVSKEIESLGVRAMPAPADVGDHAAVAHLMREIEGTLGVVTLLVNNAGNAGPQATMGLSPPFWETEPEDWDRYFRTNLQGVMNCAHAALPDMVKHGTGRIVAIVSDAGRVGEPDCSLLGGQSGCRRLVRAIAKEAAFRRHRQRDFPLDARAAARRGGPSRIPRR